jgi:hypothetical protein
VSVLITDRWRQHAACWNTNDPSPFLRARRIAPAVCSTCPASEPCLWSALAFEQITGYCNGCWGGTTAARRRRILHQIPLVDLTAWYEVVASSWQPPLLDQRRPVGMTA